MIILPHHKRHRPPLVLSPYTLQCLSQPSGCSVAAFCWGNGGKIMMEGVDRVETGWRNALWVISGSTQTHTICSNTPVKPETLRWRLELLGSGEGPLRTFLSPLFFLALLFSRLAHPSVSVFTPDRTPACSVLIIKSPLGVLVCVAQHVCVCVCADTCLSLWMKMVVCWTLR